MDPDYRPRLTNPATMFRFGVVGASGVAVNLFFFWFFKRIAGLNLELSGALAIELSIVSNFLLNNYWTFHGSGDRSSLLTKAVKYNLTAAMGLVINLAVLSVLTRLAGVYELVSHLIGIGAATTWNYAINVKWTWGKGQRT